MFTGSQIRNMNEHAARKAAREGRRPYTFWNLDEVSYDSVRALPMLGEYEPNGWEYLRESGIDVDWLVNGFGGDDGPTIGIDTLVGCIKDTIAKHPGETLGFAYTSAAQFCVTASAYRQVPKDKAPTVVEGVEAYQCNTCGDIMEEPCWVECWGEEEECDYEYADRRETDNGHEHACCVHATCDGEMEEVYAYRCSGCKVVHEEEDGAAGCCS